MPTADGKTRGAASESPALRQGRLKQSIQVGAARGGGGDIRVAAVPGEDVVVLHIAGGPDLTLHPETARDLMLSQSKELKPNRGAKNGNKPEGDPTEVQVPRRLVWEGLEQGVATRSGTRGFLGDVLLSGIDVITSLVTDKAA